MKNKLRIFVMLAIMLAFTGANAQYTGGNGRGDIAANKAATKLGNNFVTSGNWSATGNWSSGVLPATTETAHISANATIDAAEATVQSISIYSGGSLTIPSGKALTVNGALTNNVGNTGLLINSNDTGTGSLMILGSTTASGTVERFMTASKWHVVTAPASGTLSDFLTRNLFIPKITGGSYDGTQLGMMDYNTGGNNWNGYFTTGTVGSFSPGKGYMVRTATPDPIALTVLNFNGTLKAGDTKVTVTSGWNCVGNPFTTAILISNGSNSFLTVNATNTLEKTDTPIDPSHYGVYYWNDVDTKYDVVNEVSAISWAQSGQGFFIKAKANLTSTEGVTKNDFVSFTPAMQVHNTALEFKATTLPYPSIQLLAANKEAKASTDIKFINGTSKGLDMGYDAGIFKSDPNFAIYTKLVEDNGIEFQLQCLPPTGYDKMVIPVGIDSKEGGEVVFTVQTVQLAQDCKVILEDKLTNTFTNLSKDSYKAAVAANTAGTGRFYLHTGDIVSGLEDQVLSGKLTAYAQGNKEIRVIGEVGNDAVATLYNGLGKVVLTKKLGAGSLNIIGIPNISSGIYLLNINDKGTTQTIKVMLR